MDLEIIRNEDNFESSYQYINFLLNQDYQNELKIQQYFWVLDYRKIESVEYYIDDIDWDNPISHFDVLVNDLKFIDLYKKDKEEFFQKNDSLSFFKKNMQNKNAVIYEQLVCSLTVTEIENILEKLSNKGFEKAIDLMYPLHNGNILLQKIFLLFHQYNSMLSVEAIKNQAQDRAYLLQEQYDKQFVKKMNESIDILWNKIFNLIERNPSDNSDIYICNIPQYKDVNDRVGLKSNNGGYKQKLFDIDKNETTNSMLSSNYGDDKNEVEGLLDFKIVYINDGDVVKILTYDDLLSYEKDELYSYNLSYTSCYFEREKQYGVGIREQIESLLNTNPPDIKEKIKNEIIALNDFRNLILKGEII